MRHSPLLLLVLHCSLFGQVESHLPKPSIWAAQALPDLFDAKTFELLRTYPQLAVGRHWSANQWALDTKKYTLTSPPDKNGNVRELRCTPLADGTRRIIPGSERIEITLPCRTRNIKPKPSPDENYNIEIVIEKEGDKTAARLRMLDDRATAVAIGNMLPTSVPGWTPDFKGITIDSLQFFHSTNGRYAIATPAGIRYARQGGFAFYIGLQTAVEPEEFISKIRMGIEASGAEVFSKGDAEILWHAKAEDYTTMINLQWAKESQGKWIYEFVTISTLTSVLAEEENKKAQPAAPSTNRRPAGRPKQ